MANTNTSTPDKAVEAAKNGGSDAAAETGLPLFYKALEAVSRERHGAYGIAKSYHFRHAAACHALPLQLAEFVAASRCYPVVFAGEGTERLPLALVATQEGKNAFVDDAFQWTSGIYVPSYARRYPFACVRITGQEGFALAMDPTSDLIQPLSETADLQPLFEDGEASKATRHALEFCLAFEGEGERTRAFTQAMAEKDLFVPREVTLNRPGTGEYKVAGFQTLDPERVSALDDATFLDWRRKGWLDPLYAHIHSLGSFMGLLGAETRAP